AGTLTTSWLEEADCTVAATPPIVTWFPLGFGSKFVPVTVTRTPRCPATGLNPLIVGGRAVMTVKFVALVAVPPRVVTVIGPMALPGPGRPAALARPG